jgi:hypothetical protein
LSRLAAEALAADFNSLACPALFFGEVAFFVEEAAFFFGAAAFFAGVLFFAGFAFADVADFFTIVARK